jgi:hypothetical protein
MTITRTGPAFQIGIGANGKNLNFGGSGWFLWTMTHQPSLGPEDGRPPLPRIE